MSTTVTAVARRPISEDMFAGVTDSTWRPSWDGSLTTVTFDDDLDAATVIAVTAVLTSSDEQDQARRNELADLATQCQAWLTANPDDDTPTALVMRSVTAGLTYLLNRPTEES